MKRKHNLFSFTYLVMAAILVLAAALLIAVKPAGAA